MIQVNVGVRVSVSVSAVVGWLWRDGEGVLVTKMDDSRESTVHSPHMHATLITVGGCGPHELRTGEQPKVMGFVLP